MSSVNPVFLFPRAVQAHADTIAAGLHASITQSVGQLCTQPGLIFLRDDENSRGLVRLLMSIASPTPPEAMLSEPIRALYERQVAIRASSAGVQVLVDSRVAKAESMPGSRCVARALHAVSADTFLQTPALWDEIFGPYSLIVFCEQRRTSCGVPSGCRAN